VLSPLRGVRLQDEADMFDMSVDVVSGGLYFLSGGIWGNKWRVRWRGASRSLFGAASSEVSRDVAIAAS
jgi:hypothetical protein